MSPPVSSPSSTAPQESAPPIGATDTRGLDGPTREESPRVRRGRALVRPIVTIVLAVATMWALSAIALLIYTRGARSPELHVLEIPAGTAQLVAAGENPLEIPSTWNFLADDTLRLVNRDDVQHWIGLFHVPPQETVEYTLGTTVGGSLFCTVHPDEAIVIDVEARTFDWRLTLFPTLVLGPAVGLVLVGVGWAMSHLDEPDASSPSSPSSPQPSGKEPHHDR